MMPGGQWMIPSHIYVVLGGRGLGAAARLGGDGLCGVVAWKVASQPGNCRPAETVRQSR